MILAAVLKGLDQVIHPEKRQLGIQNNRYLAPESRRDTDKDEVSHSAAL